MTAEPLAAPVEAKVVAAKLAVTLNPPAPGGQPLRDPLVDLSSWEKISQGAEAVRPSLLLYVVWIPARGP